MTRRTQTPAAWITLTADRAPGYPPVSRVLVLRDPTDVRKRARQPSPTQSVSRHDRRTHHSAQRTPARALDSWSRALSRSRARLTRQRRGNGGQPPRTHTHTEHVHIPQITHTKGDKSPRRRLAPSLVALEAHAQTVRTGRLSSTPFTHAFHAHATPRRQQRQQRARHTGATQLVRATPCVSASSRRGSAESVG